MEISRLQRRWKRKPASAKKHIPAASEDDFSVHLKAISDLIREAERETTIAFFSNGRTLDNLICLVDKAISDVDVTVEKVREASGFRPKLTCHAGCSWCCRMLVEVTAIEAIVIAAYLQERLAPDDLAEVKRRVADLDTQSRGLACYARFALLRPCPLLLDNLCLVYPVRPLVCRGFNSTDVDLCQTAVAHPGQVAMTKADPIQYRITMSVQIGLGEGMRDAGLSGDRLELTAALRVALETPDVLERWFKGEPIFEAAQVTPEPT